MNSTYNIILFYAYLSSNLKILILSIMLKIICKNCRCSYCHAYVNSGANLPSLSKIVTTASLGFKMVT